MIDSINKFLNDEQDLKIVERVYTRIKDLLATDETLEYIAVQKKPAVNISPDSIAVTDKRIIIFRSKNLGFTMDFEDYIWNDVVDCHIKEGLLGAEFILKPIRGLEVKVDFLPKVQARKLYQLARQKGEEQREVRRRSEPEEKKETSAEITVTNVVEPPAPVPSAENFPPEEKISTFIAPPPPAPLLEAQPQNKPLHEDPAVALQKLKSLFDNGLITAQDFENKKAEILKRL
ncbi:MAG: PH domain-containing protein [Candidatus Azobacteroides sp.]|nr:PH domain-containing protein [Candidatus Azobacteroides sp.]